MTLTEEYQEAKKSWDVTRLMLCKVAYHKVDEGIWAAVKIDQVDRHFHLVESPENLTDLKKLIKDIHGQVFFDTIANGTHQ